MMSRRSRKGWMESRVYLSFEMRKKRERNEIKYLLFFMEINMKNKKC
jgi:hypothetical protein